MRLDQYLLNNGLFPSREKAKAAIEAGQVSVNGEPCRKASYKIIPGREVTVASQTEEYVSRSGHKLAAALRQFSVSPQGLACLDVGSSTGGFTECLIKNGAISVHSVDVGSDQMHKKVAQDRRVHLHENTDIRDFQTDQKFDLITVDVSFISLTKIFPHIARFQARTMLLLFKPQFEVGKEYLKKGISKHPDPTSLIDTFAQEISPYKLLNTFKVPLKGKQGNQEFFLYLAREN